MEYDLKECIEIVQGLDLKDDIKKYAAKSDKDIDIDEVENDIKDSLISIFENLVECDFNNIKLINQTKIIQTIHLLKKANDLCNDMKINVGFNSVRKIDKVEYYLREIEGMLSSPIINFEDSTFLKYYTYLDWEPKKRSQDFEALGRILEWDYIYNLILKICQGKNYKLDLKSITLEMILWCNKIKEKENSPKVAKAFEDFTKRSDFIMNGFSEKQENSIESIEAKIMQHPIESVCYDDEIRALIERVKTSQGIGQSMEVKDTAAIQSIHKR